MCRSEGSNTLKKNTFKESRFFHYSGLKFIWSKFRPQDERVIPSGPFWAFVIYTICFFIASQAYDNRIAIIENRAGSIFPLLALDTRKMALQEIPHVQNMKRPFQPKYWNPVGVLLSLIGIQTIHPETVNLLKGPFVSFKTELAKLDLENVYLDGTDLNGGNLQEANLRGAHLSRVNFQKINLFGSDLRGADLEEGDFQEANISAANLTKASLKKANFHQAELSEVNMSEANVSKANLSKANLQGANLSKTDLYKSNLKKSDLRGALLQQADFSLADLQGVDLRGANLREARNLTCRQIKSAELIGKDTQFPKYIMITGNAESGFQCQEKEN
ncbi:MAG: pentapeptide repeat-containing protein [Nitrospinales bacterium]